jgi:hypothetical protein
MTDNKSIILPTFSGKDEDFQVWWTKFRAFATAKGFVEALLGKEADLPATQDEKLDENKDDDKPKIKARTRNNLAMAYLLQAFKAQADISLAYETMTDDWPGGLAYEVVEQLMAVYKPDDNMVEIEVYAKLHKVKMKKKEDPKTLFEQVAAIQNWYNTATRKLAKEQMIAVILRAAPVEYASVLTTEEQKHGKALQLSHLRVAMNKYYRSVYKGRTGGNDDNEESELSLANKDQKGNKKKFQGTCHECGKKGHRAAQCWKNPKNADRRPKWYKAEVSATTKDEEEKTSTEIQLTNLHWGAYEEFFEDDDSDIEEELALLKADKTNSATENAHKTNEPTEKVEKAENAHNNLSNTETMLRKAVANDKRNASLLSDPEIWVVDTGATTHSTGNDQGLINHRDGRGAKTQVGNGARMTTKSIADMPFKTKDGATGQINDLHLINGSMFNLVSGTKLLLMGFKMTGDENAIIYVKGDQKLMFDIKIHTPEGVLFAARLMRTAQEVGGVAKQTKTVSIMEAHRELGHMNENMTRKAAAELGWTITRGTMKVCESCAIGKAKQKNVHSKDVPNEKHAEINGRVYLDQTRIVNPRADKQPLRPYWTILVDENTSCKTTIFTDTKSGMITPVCTKMKQWATDGKEVKILRMDNGGENKQLVKTLNSKSWKLYPTIEWTARATPQHNHLAEVGFATIYGRARTLMIDAKVPKEQRSIVAQKAIETATKLDGLVPVTINGVTKTRAEHYTGTIPSFAKHLRKWGEAGTVKIKTTTTPKLEERGITCMFVGYPDNHAGDTYEMLNLETRRVMITRDVIWLNRMYFADADTIDETITNVEEEIEIDIESVNEEEEKEENEEEETKDDEPEDKPEETVTRTRSGRISRPATRLIEEVNNATIDESELEEIMAVGAGIGGGFAHTSELKVLTYEEAMAGPKARYWDKACDEEHQRMVDHAVFKAVPRSEVPKFAKILTSTWAMKQKANGTLRARLNARGFEQRPGEHYNETGISSPVVNEASIFIILILIIMARMFAELNDVKGAFLNGVFSQGEKLYMYVPKGFEKFYPANVVLLLLKTIYGLKQAAFEYWRALLKALKAVGLTRSKADPCVYFRWTKNGINIWASWVDDLLSCGHESDVKEGREAIKKYFDLDEIGELNEYVGCKVEYNRKEGWMKLTQPVLIQSFEDEFDLSSASGKCLTPAEPNSIQVNGTNILDADKHHNYRKGVGKLIHLAKYSRPTILNAVRELSKFGSKPSAANEKAMIRCMKHCVDTSKQGLFLKPNKYWDGDRNFLFEITGESDSDFAKDPETRRSVSGWATYLNGAPYVRKSKTQKFVTLSVTEAECVAATSCVQDMMFGKRLLESMGLKVKLPMTLYMDNKGGVDIFNNWSIAGHTRAVSVRFAYIRELKEQGILEIKWIKGDDNSADIYTKNLSGPNFRKHASKFEKE